MASTQQETKSEEPVFNLPFQPVGGRLDTNKIYKFSEAVSIRETFIRMITTHSADPTSWFSAYRIQKKSWANANISALDREKLLSMHFETYDQVIEFMERVFKAMGYEIIRRDTFGLIKTVPPEALLADADYMTSLLVSEYEWECSLKYYQTKGADFGPAVYKIMEDAMFTPRPHAKQAQKVTQETVDAAQGDSIMNTVEASLKKTKDRAQALPVQKTLDFDGLSSQDSTPNTKKKAKPEGDPWAILDEEGAEVGAAAVLRLAEEGQLSVKDAVRALKALSYDDPAARTLLKLALNSDIGPEFAMEALDALKTMDMSEVEAAVDEIKSTVQKKPKGKAKNSAVTAKGSKVAEKSSRKTSKKEARGRNTDTEGSAAEESRSEKQKRVRNKKSVRVVQDILSSDSSDSEGDEDEWDDMGLLAQDIPFATKPTERSTMAVIQNVQLRMFDGRNRSVEEAVRWLANFTYAANLYNWTKEQRLEAFVNNLGGAVRFWWKQLPKEVRKSWTKTLKHFHKRYCRDALSVQRSYFKTFQRQDEKPVDYLYRLNAAALKAGIDYEEDPKEFSEHLELFFDSAIEKTLPTQLRYSPFKSMQELERVLIQHETTIARNAKKNNPQQPSPAPKSEKPRVNAVDVPSPAAPTTASRVQFEERQPRPPTPPSRSNPSGNDKRQALICGECGRRGHSVEKCWKNEVCDHCHRTGHPTRMCRTLIDSLFKLREQVRGGEVTAEQLFEQLN